MTEKELVAAVVELAQRAGWLVTHFRSVYTSGGYRTPLEGDPGFPDLVLVRGDRFLIWEAKREGEQPTSNQVRWLSALVAGGVEARVVRPSDLDWITATLTARRG